MTPVYPVGGGPQQLIDTPDVLIQPVDAREAYTAYARRNPKDTPLSSIVPIPIPQSSPRLATSSSASSASAPPQPSASSSVAAAESAAHMAPLPRPPGLDAYMARDFPSHFKSSLLTSIDGHDFNKANKHQLPLARIKKIMKSDEDVRMISAEAPVLFAKACEIFILDLSLRAWAHVEHTSGSGPKRRTLQRNDIAQAIQNSELFDFLYQIIPIQPHNPDEEGTPPHSGTGHADGESRYSLPAKTPDVLLERPLQDPYGDAIPITHIQQNRANMQRATTPNSYQRVNTVRANSGMGDDGQLFVSPSGSNEYGSMNLPSMSRGTSLDPGGAISTPVFTGLPLELMGEPDTPSGVAGPSQLSGPTGYYQPGVPPMPMPQAQFLGAGTPGNHSNWLDPPATPQTATTPMAAQNALHAIHTPNYAGFAPEGTPQDDEMEG